MSNKLNWPRTEIHGPNEDENNFLFFYILEISFKGVKKSEKNTLNGAGK